MKKKYLKKLSLQKLNHLIKFQNLQILVQYKTQINYLVSIKMIIKGNKLITIIYLNQMLMIKIINHMKMKITNH